MWVWVGRLHDRKDGRLNDARLQGFSKYGRTGRTLTYVDVLKDLKSKFSLLGREALEVSQFIFVAFRSSSKKRFDVCGSMCWSIVPAQSGFGEAICCWAPALSAKFWMEGPNVFWWRFLVQMLSRETWTETWHAIWVLVVFDVWCIRRWGERCSNCLL